ncbi:MAG: hypothetical protein JXA07_06555 [Spirochaetes bacterium]|nr:hypothetical protein [Spirochaetota bacterium]
MKTTASVILGICLAAAMSLSCAESDDRSSAAGRGCPYLKSRQHALHCMRECPRHGEYRCGSRAVIAPREFVDAVDFGSEHGGMYGPQCGNFRSERYFACDRLYHGNCSAHVSVDRACPRYHGFGWKQEDALSERCSRRMTTFAGQYE